MPDMSLQPGAVFAGFTIERELGAGGMGVVYLARHPRLPRHVALKLLRTDLGADPSFVSRFEREADTVAQLDHPNIVPIDDCGAENGQLWLSMRFINGTTADKALADYEHGMPADRAVSIVEKVAAALDFAHRRQLIHRDVKPANILLTHSGDDEPEQVFLSDFGVAKAMGEIEAQATALTAAGGVVATIDYAAPEQIEGRRLDGRCDIYALGCVLYKLLVGTVPYPGETLAAKVYSRLHNPPPAPSRTNPHLPPAFDAIIATALARDPADRYPTCRALAAAARSALTAQSGDNSPTQRVGTDTDPTELVGPTPGSAGQRSTADSPRAALAPTVFTPDRLSGPHTGSGSGPGTGSDGTSGGQLPGGLHDLMRPPPRLPAAGDGSSRGLTRRRSLLAVGAVLLIAAIVVAVSFFRVGKVTGTASTSSLSSSSTPATPTTAAPSTPATSSTPVTSTASSSSATTASGTITTASTNVLPVSTSPLSPDTLIISRQVAGKFALYPIDAQSGTLGAALTPPLAVGQNPIISPDRRSIIYLQIAATGGNTIRVVAADGGSSDRLLFPLPAECASANRPAWNPVQPDQLALSCIHADQTTSLLILDVTGRLIKKVNTGLVKIDDLSFAPDGLRLTFWGSQSAKANGGAIYLQRLDADLPATPITPVTSQDNDPAFSSDGRIAFHRGTQIAVMNTDGTELRVLTTSNGYSQGPIWSPTGDLIAFKRTMKIDGASKDEIFVISPQGMGERQLGDEPGSISGSPAWGNR